MNWIGIGKERELTTGAELVEETLAQDQFRIEDPTPGIPEFRIAQRDLETAHEMLMPFGWRDASFLPVVPVLVGANEFPSTFRGKALSGLVDTCMHGGSDRRQCARGVQAHDHAADIEDHGLWN